MSKTSKGILFRIASLFITHPWLKVISLILAVIVWFYVRDEIKKFNY